MRLELKAIKNQGKLLKIGQTILLISILGVLYYQLSKFRWAEYTWKGPQNIFAVSMVVALVGLNWFFEWKKWLLISKRVGLESKNVIQRGFYAGMLSGFLTPSALGNFLGRMYAVKKEIRPKIVSFTLFGNWAQFNVSLLFGFISILLVNPLSNWMDLNQVMVFVGLVSFASLFLFFTIEKFPFLSRLLQRYAPSFTSISRIDRLHFMGLSVSRYLVFSFQFFLMIYAFQPNIDGVIYFWIWNLYLWSTLSPALFMGKLFIRETLAVYILTEVGVELPVALVASLSIWILNNALPSVFAYFKWKQDVAVQD